MIDHLRRPVSIQRVIGSLKLTPVEVAPDIASLYNLGLIRLRLARTKRKPKP